MIYHDRGVVTSRRPSDAIEWDTDVMESRLRFAVAIAERNLADHLYYAAEEHDPAKQALADAARRAHMLVLRAHTEMRNVEDGAELRRRG